MKQGIIAFSLIFLASSAFAKGQLVCVPAYRAGLKGEVIRIENLCDARAFNQRHGLSVDENGCVSANGQYLGLYRAVLPQAFAVIEEKSSFALAQMSLPECTDGEATADLGID